MDIWSIPIFALIAAISLGFFALLRLLWQRAERAILKSLQKKWAELGTKPEPENLEEQLKKEAYELTRERKGNAWIIIERLAAIMGIISFIVQVAQWVYPLL
jgi:hypothetical protein